MAYGHGLVFLGLVVNGNTEWCADGILPAVALAYAVLLFIKTFEVGFALVYEFTRYFGQSVLLGKWQHRQFYGSQHGREAQYYAAVLLVFCAQVFFLVCLTEHQHNGTVEAYGGLYHIGYVMLVDIGIEVSKLLAAILLVVLEVEVGAAVDAFHFLEAHREIIFYITGHIGIVRQFHMIVKAVFVGRYAQAQVPLHACFLPVVIPLLLRAGLHEKLHFHLLKLPHTEYKSTRHDLISECLARLRYTKGYLHSARFLHIQEVHKYTLGCFRPEVDHICFLSHRAYFGGEHEVELAYIGPVAGATYSTAYLVCFYQLSDTGKIVCCEQLVHMFQCGLGFFPICLASYFWN